MDTQKHSLDRFSNMLCWMARIVTLLSAIGFFVLAVMLAVQSGWDIYRVWEIGLSLLLAGVAWKWNLIGGLLIAAWGGSMAMPAFIGSHSTDISSTALYSLYLTFLVGGILYIIVAAVKQKTRVLSAPQTLGAEVPFEGRLR